MLGLGLGMGVGNKAPMLPVSAFPTVADIPPGMVVLDSDGVVKQKVGDFLIPVPVTIIGSGPIASAPPAGSYWGQGKVGPLYYNTTDGMPYVVVRSFHNEGADVGNWGQPNSLVSLINGNDYSCEVIGRSNNAFTFGAFVQRGKTSTLQMSISTGNTGETRWFSVGTSSAHSVGSVQIGKFSAMKLVVTPVGNIGSINGIMYASAQNGSQVATTEIFISGSSTTSNQIEGDILSVNFKNAIGQCVACFNANSPAQWDGGATAYDSAGNPITFTDGAPTGRVDYSWVKLSDAQAWGVFV